MGREKRVNALVEMHGHTLARGGTVRVDATMFSVEELEQLARAATRSGYH